LIAVTRRFLTAEWRNLVMLNYVVEPTLLRPLVPRGTELDTWHGLAFVSLVGFLFDDTRVLGVPIPGHRTFEEVNLRFYVRRDVDGAARRGVTFIRELVPRAAIALVARAAYNEPYRALPMRHRFEPKRADGIPGAVRYEWRVANEWTTLSAEPKGDGRVALDGSQEAFITEHYWGYTRQRRGGTVEYRVDHPRWRVWTVPAPTLRGNLGQVYGAEMGAILAGAPASAFLADGSRVTVSAPARLPYQDGSRLPRRVTPT
jgi:uncharacterized protein